MGNQGERTFAHKPDKQTGKANLNPTYNWSRKSVIAWLSEAPVHVQVRIRRAQHISSNATDQGISKLFQRMGARAIVKQPRWKHHGVSGLHQDASRCQDEKADKATTRWHQKFPVWATRTSHVASPSCGKRTTSPSSSLSYPIFLLLLDSSRIVLSGSSVSHIFSFLGAYSSPSPLSFSSLGPLAFSPAPAFLRLRFRC